ncbi:lipoxygenase family protein [Algoriphagus boseongensis]|uniref:lipoxygenase family protein n=1 Tax=Algoriphagus boseongensis TaxID=1442587 RepID=UPI001414DF1D|nr:lipoxygenase family protein [Algoriphagus boseongensis]
MGRSKIISNPLTILAEFGHVIFKKIRSEVQRFHDFLFPRRARVFGKNFDSKISGKVTFSRKDGVAKPIHHMQVEFWAKTWWFQWRKLGEAMTNDQGEYEISYDRKLAKSPAHFNLRMEVYQTTHIYFKEDKAVPHYSIFHKMWVRKDDLKTESFLLENFRLDFWEYRDDYPAPRVVIKDKEKDAPQYYSQARQDVLAQQFIPYELTKAKHLELLKLGSKKISLDYIQKDYPINLSRCIEQRIPGYTRSDEYFGHRQMNGMNRASFFPDSSHPGEYWVKYFGSCKYETNGIYAFPDAEIKFRLDEEGLPLPIQIILTGPLNKFEKDPLIKRSFSPEDGTEWEFAKRIARVSGSLCTEVDDHFTGTHLNTEQYAIAAYRNLRINPIANLLLPHLKEVVLINHSADKILLKDFLPHSTALTEKGLKDRTRDILGMQDWKGFQPMDPISPSHDVAKTDWMFWEITEKYVHQFVDNHLEEIKKYWLEIYCFSKDLVEHSVPVFLSDINKNELDLDLKAHVQNRYDYYCFKYGFHPDQKRETIKGELKAVSPITQHHNPENVSPEDIKNLKDCCVYIIFVATYLHTWINEHQYDELGELLFNGVGLRYGDQKKGILAPETDLSIAPDLKSATEMLWIVNLLSRTEFGFITRNEEGDVNPIFSKMLLEKKEEFLHLGVEVENIESRTNI